MPVILAAAAHEPLSYFRPVRLFRFCRVLVANEDHAMNAAQKKPVHADEFASFMLAYQDMVFSTAARLLGDDRQAEDIAQEVFVKAYQQFVTLRDSDSAGGWLKTVATNLCLNHLSRYRKRWRMFSEFARKDDDADDVDIEFSADDVCDDSVFNKLSEEQQHMLFEAALMQLPDHQRIPLVMYHFDGVSYDDIAAQLRITLSKLKTDILRGRAALAKSMQHHVKQFS